MIDKSEITQIKTKPDPFEAFNLSQAIAFGDLIFVSGQAALDLEGNIQGIGNFDLQAEVSIKNLEKVLKAGGSDLSKVLKVTIFMKDMNQYTDINKIYSSFFNDDPPAREAIEVSKLPKDVNVEISVIARK